MKLAPLQERIGIGLIEQLAAAHRGNAAGFEPDHQVCEPPKLGRLMADVNHRDADLVAQAFKIGQDFPLAGNIE